MSSHLANEEHGEGNDDEGDEERHEGFGDNRVGGRGEAKQGIIGVGGRDRSRGRASLMQAKCPTLVAGMPMRVMSRGDEEEQGGEEVVVIVVVVVVVVDIGGGTRARGRVGRFHDGRREAESGREGDGGHGGAEEHAIAEPGGGHGDHGHGDPATRRSSEQHHEPEGLGAEQGRRDGQRRHVLQ